MFRVFINAWKVKDIRKKLLYAVLLVAIYRIGCTIPMPGVSLVAWQYIRTQGSNQTLFAAISGGGTATIFQMGIGPYITSSIIIQLLTVAIPKLEQMQKEGEEGRKKISQYTRYVAVALAFLQGAGIVYSLNAEGMFVYSNWLVWGMATLSLVAGTTFVMWLSELLTEKAIGNGSSFIIFSNILSGVPRSIFSLYYTITGSDLTTGAGWFQIAGALALVVLFLFLIGFAILVQDGERRRPVQYSKKMVGRQMYGGQSSFIPMKVNIAGVMAIIFAISILQLPATLYGFFPNNALYTLNQYLSMTHPVGAAIYMVLIVCFTFFYTSFAVNPIEMAENMRKNGGFIPGIRPGKPTSDYISRTVKRLSSIGSVFYVILAMVPIVFQWIFKVQAGFGGTTLLIVTGVALEIVKQTESQLLMRHYKGFLN